MSQILLNGIAIQHSNLCPTKPKMKLSELVTVTPSFRREMDAWMLDFFGSDEESIVINNGSRQIVFVGTKTWNALVAKSMEGGEI